MQRFTESDRPVLVTGGAGFIGGHLVEALSRAGHRVRVLDDLSTGLAATVQDLPGVRLVRGSVLDAGDVSRAAEGTGLVIHLAGVVGMRLAAEMADHAYRVGREGTDTVLRHTGGTPVVLVSSSAVYGLSDGSSPLDDELPVDRSVPLAYDGGAPGYATGKWEMERLGLDAAARRPVLIVRPFNVVGPRQSGRYGMVLPTFWGQAQAGVALTVHGDGSQRRCFTDVGQFIGRLRELCAAPRAWQARRPLYNIGSVTSTSITELAALVLKATGGTAGITHVPYESVFPGRVDVTGRVPRVDRLRDLTGETVWLPAASIVAKMLADRTGKTPEPHCG
ncbi:NAD-dependent epimerase/dehydratase family protein [Streptomyces sp. NBC_00859]|uniref:NAD-dependent epimerase/dehydratase family protein n=1 Tax=Streptomyces sp. NBC_00859 TaxID=2903682 RepID=UPI0038662ED4|nr:NAD-dependent epimerase/dehydratase family protein [Streptomyces sp. NBC_00859]WSZ86713.1 NAD-dependent epimerase/dehydratase family protein [Streptomyces sp. NBC_00859]